MTGALLLQLGTPDAPTAPALRRYLAEFLWDRRVIDLPRWQWWPILHGIILRTRPARSAALYAKVWAPGGSPLAVTSAAQARLLGERVRVPVEVAMRYGRPSIAQAVDALLAAGVTRLLAFPMYPQYAGATTGSSLEKLFADLGRRRVVPAVRVVPPYPTEAAYIAALTARLRPVLGAATPPDHLVISFHGLPKRYAEEGDPYPEQCRHTAEALLAATGWPVDRASLTFQSRFGREQWLQPYTDKTLEALPGRGAKRVAVICPGFTADCLETLEEIGITGRHQFLDAGGEDYQLVPCLNDSAPWIDAMETIARRELSGW